MTDRSWNLPESAVTPESVYLNRRAWLKSVGFGSIAAAATLSACGPAESEASDDPSAGLYPVPRNRSFTVERELTPEREATTYNNFYEFGSHKGIWQAAQALEIRPWAVRVEGMVAEEKTVDIDTLLQAMPLEERIYRFRCVEAWAMTVPWSGFPLKALLDYIEPLSSARYVVFQTFQDPSIARGQRQVWYPWPYTEGLTIEEAANDLAFMATGLYGKPLPKQNGAPIRLVTPWKYGFKSIKSIDRIILTDQRPETFWEALQPAEYGFWANVNPEVPHPRWSQAEERLLGKNEKVPTQLFNGYARHVAHLYAGLQGETLYR